MKLFLKSDIFKGIQSHWISKTRNMLAFASVKTLYASIMEVHFSYCCPVWGCCGISHINQLQKLQNRAVRIVMNCKFDAPIGPLIQSLGWKIIREIVDEESKLMVYKSIYGLAPQYMRKLFIRNSV